MHLILFDEPIIQKNLLPLTFTRPVAYLRVGILTIIEKYQKKCAEFTTSISTFSVEKAIQNKYQQTAILEPTTEFLYVNGAVCPDEAWIETIKTIGIGEVILYQDGTLLACKSKKQLTNIDELLSLASKAFLTKCKINFPTSYIRFPWDIFLQNRAQIIADFALITKGRKSQPITDKHTIVYGTENVFLEEGAVVKAAIINAEDAPVYIGKNAVVHEGAIIKGAFALCEGAHVNMGAKMRGDTTIGIYSKAGGEISNSVIFGYSNKAHDGFLGNSVIGEWCNLGADTNTSNLKNNYSEVKVWNYQQATYVGTGLQFCGLIMGDHSKSGINTMFNTGTVVGVAANVFGAGFPAKFIPSFSWGGATKTEVFHLDKAFEVAERVMERRKITLSEDDKQILTSIFEKEQAKK